MTLKQKKIIRIFIICLGVAITLSISAIPSDRIVNFIGSENAYLLMFMISFIGSISTFASIPYPLFVLSLSAGGFNPLFIGLASALGVITADSLTFIISSKSEKIVVSPKIRNAINILKKHTETHPTLITPGLLLYGTFAPLSNDFAVISFALMKYKFSKIIPPLALGNILYNLALAYGAIYANSWFS